MNEIDEIVIWVSSRLDENNKFDIGLQARIEHSAWNLRATYAEREINKFNKFPKALIQNLGRVEMEEVDAAEICDLDDGCKVWRSKRKIPRPIQIRRDDKFEYVGSINGQKRFGLGNDFQIANMNILTFAALSPYYNYKNDRVYSSVKNLNIRGAFEDPREAAEFNDCDGSDCDTSINSFMPADWVESIKLELLKIFSPYINKEFATDISPAGNGELQPK